MWSAERVALWLEEGEPGLRYALVTAAEQPGAAGAAEMEEVVARTRFARGAALVAARALAVPVGVLAAALVIMLVTAMLGGGEKRAARGGESSGASAGGVDQLAKLVARVEPPAYSRIPARTIEEPAGISALVGSRLTIVGPGGGAEVTARLGASAQAVVSAEEGWRVTVRMPARAMALALGSAGRQRLVILEPVADSAPVVTLLAPGRDTVLRAAEGTIDVSAEARDDLGLDDLWLEYIVSSGEGESFTFKSGVLARQSVAGARGAAVRGALRLGALGLKPGDLVHVRAVARDRNDVSGPDSGESETRTIRVARRGEYDSVAVEGAPPPDADKSVLSERMLILLAEDLERRRGTLARGKVVDESRGIARDQASLRRQVSRVVFARLGGGGESEETQGLGDARGALSPEALLRAADSATGAAGGTLDFEGDETPVVAINRPLLEAYNAMWDAGRFLEIGEPGKALPSMRVALAAIQRAREAERLYLRGRAPVVVVDLAKVRLAGRRDDAAGARRMARGALDSTAARRTLRLDAALALLAARPAAGVDSLLLLRVDAIAQDPALAAALGAAIDDLRAGRDATASLARARRVAAGGSASLADGVDWEGRR